MARLWVGVFAAVFCTLSVGNTTARPEVLALKLFHIHTEQYATIVFKRNGVYDRAGLAKIDAFLRDWRKDQPTHMDPHLLDLLYQVYQQSGSHDYIHVVCGYRSPDTNSMLRRRSRGVAKNSLHMQGKAVDFFIPGVALPKLRAIGLRMQLGGVGFYPTSGSPFVHMDTGSVRHWPRMTRQQLVAVFPNGRTLHVPSDGKPLPGYAQALAAYQARKVNGGNVAVASFTPAPAADDTAPIQLASASDDEADDAATVDETTTASAPVAKAVAVAAYATTDAPMPRLAPRRVPAASAAIAMASATALPTPRRNVIIQSAAPIIVASLEPSRNSEIAPDFDFGPPQDWSSPAVPAALARAMAERDQVRRGSSLPIPPTSVVATIDVSRPLRAEAITTAVLRSSNEAISTVPHVLGYADATGPEPVARPRSRVTVAGVPLPQISPRRASAFAAKAPAPRALANRPRMEAPALTLTSLDTQGLRMWISNTSTRQKMYALLTMPDFAQSRELMAKPEVTFGAGFGQTAYANLRTDRFTGALVQQPSVVDLTLEPLIASIR